MSTASDINKFFPLGVRLTDAIKYFPLGNEKSIALISTRHTVEESVLIRYSTTQMGMFFIISNFIL